MPLPEVHVSNQEPSLLGSRHSGKIIQIVGAAAINLTCSICWTTSAVSDAVLPPQLELTQTRGALLQLLHSEVVDRNQRREGDDALAIGLLNKRYQGESPYYSYDDYYGPGDYYTVPRYLRFQYPD